MSPGDVADGGERGAGGEPSAGGERITVRFPGGSYPVLVGEGALDLGLEEAARALGGRTVFVITSPPVWALHGSRLAPALESAARVHRLEVVDGEAAKSIEVAGDLWRRMLAAGGKRDSVVVAFGGGSVGDLAGFVAGAFLRGVRYLQVPTTLLAQVDASVGGKTAVDLPEGKNSVGLFHQPVAVVADTRLLLTLSAGELRAGLVEVIKMAALLDLDLLAAVETRMQSLLAGDPEALAPVVAAAVRAKARVVEADPFEAGERRLLNFGHTLGHAIEAVTGYRALRHGEAVGWGMLFALRLARRRGMAADQAERIESLLRALSLPALPSLSVAELLAAIARDKKATEEAIPWVLPERLGRGTVVSDLSKAAVENELVLFLRDS